MDKCLAGYSMGYHEEDPLQSNKVDVNIFANKSPVSHSPFEFS